MHSPEAYRLGILIPAYNDNGATLRELERELDGVLTTLPDWEAEILVVDDGSSPSLSLSQDGCVQRTLIRHSANLGKGAALKTGFHHFLNGSRAAVILTLDADLQHPPRLIPRFLTAYREQDAELVIGVRERVPGKMPLLRIFSNATTSRLISLLIGSNIRDSQCGYRLYTRSLLERIRVEEDRFQCESEFLIRAGWKAVRISEVPIPTIYNDSRSAIRHVPDTLNFISMVFKLLWRRWLGYV